MERLNGKNLKSINYQTFFNLIALVIVNGFSFIVTPIISNLVGPSGYGVCSIYVTYVNIFSIICGLKMSSALNSARIKFEENFNEYASSTLLFSLFTSIAFFTIGIFFIKPLSVVIEIEPLYVTCIGVNGIASYVIIFMNGVQLNRKETQWNLARSFAIIVSTTLLSVILLKINGGHYSGRIFGLVIPNVIIAAICIGIIFKRRTPIINKEYWKFGVIFGIPIVFQDLASVILGQADRVMLQKSMDFSTSGIYSLAVTFSHITAVIFQAINQSWVPYYYDDVHTNNAFQIQGRVKACMLNMSLIAIGFVMVFQEIYRIYAPSNYHSGGVVIPILAFGCYMQFLYYFPVNHELYKGNTIYVACGTISAGIINIILNYFLIPIYGMVGAAIATSVAYTLLFVFHDILVRVLYRSDYYINRKYNYLSIISVVGFYLLFYIFRDNWLIRWIIGGLVGIYLLYRLIKRKSLF